MESNLNKPRLVPMDTEKMSVECKEILKRIPGDAFKNKCNTTRNIANGASTNCYNASRCIQVHKLTN